MCLCAALFWGHTLSTSQFAISQYETGFHAGCVWFNRLMFQAVSECCRASKYRTHTCPRLVMLLLSSISQPQSVCSRSSSQHEKVSMGMKISTPAHVQLMSSCPLPPQQREVTLSAVLVHFVFTFTGFNSVMKTSEGRLP